jgi:signal transduction histidine kinase
MTFAVWLKYRNHLLQTLFYFWLSGIVSYFAQAAFNQFNMLGLIAFGFNAITVNILIRLQLEALEIKKNITFYNQILITSLLLGLTVIQVNGNYSIGAFVFCLGCSFSLIHAAITIKDKTESDIFTKSFQFLLIFAGLHFLDYSFFRLDLTLSIIGFSISILFYFLFAVFVPILILQKMSNAHTKDLEIQVQTRTQQLDNSYKQLNQTFNIMMADKLHIKNLLADLQLRMSAVVHDLSTPLQILSYNFKIISTGAIAESEILEKRSARVSKAIQSIIDILSDAKKSHSDILGKSDLKLQSVDILSIFRDILNNYDEKISSKNITVNLDFPELTNWSVIANENWLKFHVFSNLISNSIKFTKVNGQIHIKGKIAETGRVQIIIEDNGVGIAPEMREEIFRVENKTSTKGTLGETGTGLGLPLVKQYTELMGGTVKLLNRNLPGTCFELEFLKSIA